MYLIKIRIYNTYRQIIKTKFPILPEMFNIFSVDLFKFEDAHLEKNFKSCMLIKINVLS